MLLREVLAPNPLRTTYMLGDLDPSYFPFTRWYISSETKGVLPQSIAMVYGGLRLPVLITHGSPQGLDPALEMAVTDLPGDIFALVERTHEVPLGRHYDVSGLRSILRMGIKREDFEFSFNGDDEVVVLSHADTGDLMELYQHYPDNLFEPFHLEGGIYCGIRKDGKLMSVAGTHVISEEFRVAALGNIVTHQDYRGQGLAKRCVGVVLSKLFEHVDHVGLNTHMKNEAAQKTFASLGFEAMQHCLEGVVHRRT
jgi:ribosomal protein S18 acetylase RimI-like enzyme